MGVPTALEYLDLVDQRAQELYAASRQGPWEALPEELRAFWRQAADQELRPTLGGALELSMDFRPGIDGGDGTFADRVRRRS